MKYSKVSGVVQWSGGAMTLSVGMTADDDHPLVVERPDLFSDGGPAPALRSPDGDARRAGPPKVERGTRAPGERRS